MKKLRRHRYEIVWCVVLLGSFVILPCVLMSLGFSRTVTLSFVIGLVALLSDGFLTKVGLERKCSEVNPLFGLLKGRVKKDHMIVLSRIVGIVLLLYILFVFNDEFLLLVFALSLMTCVIANAFTRLNSIGKV